MREGVHLQRRVQNYKRRCKIIREGEQLQGKVSNYKGRCTVFVLLGHRRKPICVVLLNRGKYEIYFSLHPNQHPSSTLSICQIPLSNRFTF